ncbi:hypothetical protein RM530_17400 [Algiphilus sp. W345]|uniref:Uncharacterized protein n=1 Tax=Banduia mediterranea TaxID=3075609 RepID=A0ABU2WPX4_9GAMM|nr:hypothetical protein [Algiphilus sp. W345]MDT0499122.1 hypothetical protein [Algiphilus sp. W345]
MKLLVNIDVDDLGRAEAFRSQALGRSAPRFARSRRPCDPIAGPNPA